MDAGYYLYLVSGGHDTGSTDLSMSYAYYG
jgi:hypothetical protein